MFKFSTKGYNLALKDDLSAVKQELSMQEKWIESYIKGERFIRKYKFIFLGIISFLLAYGIYSYASGVFKERNLEKANEIYLSLNKNPNDTFNLEILKNKNADLYVVFLLSNNALITDFSARAKEALSLKINPLLKNILALSIHENSKFLGNYAKLLEAFELLKQDKIEEADVLLSKIPLDSSLSEIANNLKHYKGIKAQ